ncbi:hypothetical protein Droror1_Dr00015689 [Drosera rotundifolia]
MAVEESAKNADAVEEGQITAGMRGGGGGGEDVFVATGNLMRKRLEAIHPLENLWTFWFDNPNAKSKQTAWGSSIRPVYTFSTVEDFWSSVVDLTGLS